MHSLLRAPAIAQVGGFRPPDDPATSWFGRSVCLLAEQIPSFRGTELFSLLQIRCTELPFIPPALADIALLVVYMNRYEIPFELPHGEGWLVREYTASQLANLVPFQPKTPPPVKPFPIRWRTGPPERPSWEEASTLLDMSAINDSIEGHDEFFDFPHHYDTKVGGYPTEVQHIYSNTTDYVFQIGVEEKAQWMWGDAGVAVFGRNAGGEWSFDCQSH
ncbi:MAG TPA: DUF1963 domain-containing protein [Verrucomicrobiae bacterium]